MHTVKPTQARPAKCLMGLVEACQGGKVDRQKAERWKAEEQMWAGKPSAWRSSYVNEVRV